MKIPLDDVDAWVEYGEQSELAFIEKYGKRFGLTMHPDKETNKFAPDFTLVADLKTCNTPFFTAHVYGLNPQYTVVLNGRAYHHYTNDLPGIIIYFHVIWKVLSWGDIIIEPHEGVYRTTIPHLQKLIQEGKVQLHTYKNVKPNRNNEHTAYLIDYRMLEEVK